MKLSKKRKNIIETLYREYHGLQVLGERSDVEWLSYTFGLAKRQAKEFVEFVRCEGYRFPSYRYYETCMNDIKEVWEYYYDNK